MIPILNNSMIENLNKLIKIFTKSAWVIVIAYQRK